MPSSKRSAILKRKSRQISVTGEQKTRVLKDTNVLALSVPWLSQTNNEWSKVIAWRVNSPTKHFFQVQLLGMLRKSKFEKSDILEKFC